MEFQEKAKRHLRERLRVAKEDLQRNPDDYYHRLDVVRFSELLAELEENRNSGQQGSLNPLELWFMRDSLQALKESLQTCPDDEWLIVTAAREEKNILSYGEDPNVPPGPRPADEQPQPPPYREPIS